MKIIITKPNIESFKAIAEFVSNCDVLVGNDPHFYRIILEYFGDTIVVATDEKGKIMGFAFGFVSQVHPEHFFLWQIGVDNEQMGKGIGSKLIESLKVCVKSKNCTLIRATVIYNNFRAINFFEKHGFENVSRAFAEAEFGKYGPFIPDYYGENEDIVLFELEI